MEKGLKAERLRQRLARQKRFRELKGTYNSSLPEIKNLNTAALWDNLLKSQSAHLMLSPIYMHKLEMVANFLKKKEGSVLDIGFGFSPLEDFMNRDNPRLKLHGIDISPQAVIAARNKFRGIFKEGNIISIPFKAKTFDYVVALDVLEHISPTKTFKAYFEIRRVLKKNGVFITSVPLNEGLDAMFKKGINPNAHVRDYTPLLIKAELKIAGFKIFKERYLFAFRHWYTFKSLAVKLFPEKVKYPNLIIIFAER